MSVDDNTSPGWGSPSNELTQPAIDALLRRRIPAVRVAAFATAAECARFAERLHHVSGVAADTSPMRLVGSNFSNHHTAGRRAYFQSVARSERSLRTLTETSFDPVQRVIDALATSWSGDVAVADEGPPDGRYFAGCVKTRVNGSALHYDFVPDMVAGYAIARISAQLSWNLYLEMPGGTGETTLYDKAVEPQRDLIAREPGAAARWDNLVDPQAVAGCDRYTFKPRVGELVLFNTRCPHAIVVDDLAAQERRTQIGGFAGLTTDGNLILWS